MGSLEIQDILGVKPVCKSHLDANITPSALVLNLFFRTHSTGISPKEFWGNSLIPRNVTDDEKEEASVIQNSWDEVNDKTSIDS